MMPIFLPPFPHRYLALVLCGLMCLTALPAQDLYLVRFTHKTATAMDAADWFDPAALARRHREGLPPWDWTDLPVDSSFVAAVAGQVDSLRYTLRWFNGVTLRATPTQIATVAALPCVQAIEPLTAQAYLAQQDSGRLDTLLGLQRHALHLDCLADSGLDGQGIRIAVLDAGFQEADTHPALAHLYRQGRIIAVRDFYQGDDNPYHHSRHGTEVMSCIGGRYGERPLGAAPAATFLLARIEHRRREKAIEEDHWLAAAEWADRLGATILNSSVNYISPRYTYADMDGQTAPVSRAAKMAAAKGILVVCAMGNEGDRKWHYLGAPADVPEVLSVGGSLPMLPLRIAFSSFGPNARQQRKPDLAAPGFVLSAARRGTFDENAGTSFSAPLLAGLAACLWQHAPHLTRAQLTDRLYRLGHHYPYYDYEVGYGVPDARRLFTPSPDTVAPTFGIAFRGDSVLLHFPDSLMITDSAAYPHGRILSYHLENPQGQLDAAFSLQIPHQTRYYYFRRRREAAGTLRIWFAGYLYETAIAPLE